ncbi:rhomboid family intramembrane serine protease [Fulvivirga kasyanovii]|uniref:Rhomboid family intramembrane serine protease n=1 Tax=Fulvivirga kasyanovii TaxID=396812 RepID=A0ABW9RXB8_9BACT|nr:rhomboid family intramembrane serine protease [Fulvivirga kasyanovii]MTI27919.1 rhomboid family intramembrane serine protease [Fulvivirga kasyanovii]
MSVTLILVIITVLTSLYAWNNQDILRKWIFNPYSVNEYGQYYRFITSGFIHNDFIHLLFNMLVLWMFGEQVEYIFAAIYGVAGKAIFVALYILGIIVSDIPTYLKHKDHAYYNALGASGGVASVLFSFILFAPAQKLYLYGIIGLPGIVWAALYILYSAYMGKRQGDNINHDAHLYGGLFGIVFTILVYPKVISHFIGELGDLSFF